jgi:D-methionine transport system permease protein
VALVGYSAMSGVIGGGGLGDLAVRYGYQRFNTPVMLVTVAILVVIVQVIQVLGDRLVARFTHR